MAAKSNKALISGIVGSAVLISASLVFVGVVMLNGVKVKSFENGLFAQELKAAIETLNNEDPQAKTQNDQDQVVRTIPSDSVMPVSAKDDHILGESDSPISVIEYSDFECPWCKKFHQDGTPKKIVDAYKGKVNFVYRHFVAVTGHNPLATQEAQASECASALGGNDAFWKYHDALFARTTSNGNGLKLEDLSTIATETGLNTSSFDTCFQSEKYASIVEEDMKSGAKVGVGGTPGTVVINNETGEAYLVKGAQPFETFKDVVEQLL